MVNVTLDWSPGFEVGEKHGLDYLISRTTLPAVPVVGDIVFISSYHLEEGKEPEKMADYFTFVVERIHYYLEGPEQPPEIMVLLGLQSEHQKNDEEFESWICEVLTKVYNWQKEN